MRLILLALAASLVQGAALAQTSSPVPGAAAPPAAAPTEAEDPFLWLEEAESPRALDWAKAQNARSLGLLEKDPRYAALHAAALTIVDAKDRIPTPTFRAGRIYNLWQDQDHPQGLWRRTSLDSYRTSAPAWEETVLDLDALSKAEGKTWVWKGASCLQPAERRCLITLSDGGEDAAEVREFDLAAKAFVADGFRLPRSKQDVAWLDADTLILGRDWGPGTMTQSGYAYVIKTLGRGQPLDAAKEVFRGKATDVGVSPYDIYDGATGARAVLINRAVTFFESETYVLTPQGAVKLPLPAKSTVQGMTGGRLIFTIDQDWTPEPGRSYPQGALLAADFAELKAGGTRSVQVLFAPGPRESIEQVAVARDRVLAAAYENVKGRALVFTPGAGGWSRHALPLPDKAAVSLVDADDKTDRAFIQVESYLEPPTLYLVDAAGDAPPTPVKSLPPRFDASRDMIEQFEATSKDGTRVPYFVVRPKDLKFDGSAPTLLYAYGGFQVSLTPGYSSTVGKLWLERGGVYVVANIRGGGEFGPAWHEAGLKTNRQRIYDDFAAVAQDLIARKITSPRRLGIEGGSNGGLLMGVELEQHPQLWNAVVIQVPLLDMLRFTKIGAGASWVGEYGSPDVPAERAFLASISPYQNLKAGVRYPEPLLVTSTKDDRVSPAHARKFAAKMAAMGLPFLYYENIEGGHSAAANLHETAHRVSLEMTYLTRKLMD